MFNIVDSNWGKFLISKLKSHIEVIWISILIILFIIQLINNPLIFFEIETITVISTVFYVFLTYKILKSNERINKIEFDPILRIKPISNNGIISGFNLIREREFIAHRPQITIFIKSSKIKEWIKLDHLKCADLMGKEESYSYPLNDKIIKYYREKKIEDDNFTIDYHITYKTKIDTLIHEHYMKGNIKKGKIKFMCKERNGNKPPII